MTQPSFNPHTAKQDFPWDDLAHDRSHCPVVRSARMDAVQVVSYEGVKQVLADHGALSNTYNDLVPLEKPLPIERQALGWTDPPRHTRQRRLLIKALSASRIQNMRPFSERLVDDLIDAIAEEGTTFDILAYARKVSEGHISELLGIPEKDLDDFKRMVRVLENSIGEQASDTFGTEVSSWIDRLTMLVRTKREAGPADDDLITQLCFAEENGDWFNELEVAGLIQILAGAGISTTARTIVNTAWLLDENPPQKARYLADIDGLTASLVEETLRFEPAFLAVWRRCLADTTIGEDFTVSAGEKVYSVIAAANHDPQVYDRPDEFIVDRDWKQLPPHLSFGHGIHHCIGMNLARLEIDTAVSTLYRRLPNLRRRPGSRVERIPGPVVRRWHTLEMTFDGPALRRKT